MKKQKPLQKLFRWWKALHLTDQILLIFMLILQLQTAYNLFTPGSVRQDTAALDVVIRTTAAAVFGYFISAGFRKDAQKADLPQPPCTDVQINSKQEKNNTNSSEAGSQKRIRQQTIIVAAIGIFSLLILIFARNNGALNSTSTAALSQLRDFVSGSVGFLIGHSAKESG